MVPFSNIKTNKQTRKIPNYKRQQIKYHNQEKYETENSARNTGNSNKHIMKTINHGYCQRTI